MHRILLIEDDPLVREGLILVLKMEGLLVTELLDFDDVPGALTNTQVPDLILADWRLPQGQTGVEAALKVQKHFGQDIPLLIITGESSETVTDLLRQGYNVVRKPATVSDLLTLMGRIILRDKENRP